LSTNCGLLKMEPQELREWRRHPDRRPSFVILDALDGAQPLGRGLDFQPTASLGPDGKIWFVTGTRIATVDPEHIYKNLLRPPVHVEQVIADNRPFEPSASLRLPPNPRTLQIDYTALSVAVPQKVQFRYRLEGHDQTWQGPVTRRQAFYTDLPPGH